MRIVLVVVLAAVLVGCAGAEQAQAATQAFQVVVAPEPGNHPPVITSQPVTRLFSADMAGWIFRTALIVLGIATVVTALIAEIVVGSSRHLEPSHGSVVRSMQGARATRARRDPRS